MVKIIHGADFHLDSPFSGLSPDRAAQRRSEQRLLLEELARLAREQRADLVLLSGDLLDGRLVFRETAQALAQALGGAGCPVFIAPGNHDCYTAGCLYATLQWPDNVHIFRSHRPEGVHLPQLGCTVWGRAFVSPHQEGCPLEGLDIPRDGQLHLGCFHGDTAPASQYGPITPGQIARSGLTYLALGHIHQSSGLCRAGEVWWAYPGCPQGRGFDELGEKGVLCLEVEPGRVSGRLVPLGGRRYELLEVDLTGQSDQRAAIQAALPPDAGEHIFKLILTGQSQRPDLAALERALSPLCYGLTIRDNTRLPQDLWARRGEDSLTGLFLQIMWDKCQSDPDSQLLQLAARYGLAALEQGEEGAL